MTPDEFGKWLESRVKESVASFYNGSHWSEAEYERGYGRMSEAEDILSQWNEVKRDGSE